MTSYLPLSAKGNTQHSEYGHTPKGARPFLVRLWVLVAACCSVHFGLQAQTTRERLTRSVVLIDINQPNQKPSHIQPATGTGVLIGRPYVDPYGEDYGQASRSRLLLITNKHVLPLEGQAASIYVRVPTKIGGVSGAVRIAIPIVDSNGKYLPGRVRLHPTADVAVVMPDESNMGQSTLDTSIILSTRELGVREKLGTSAAQVGDDIYIIGYPGGLFSTASGDALWRVGIISSNRLAGYRFPEELAKRYHLPSVVDGFLIDAGIYPGSSGSIVVARPGPSLMEGGAVLTMTNDRVLPYILGIVSHSIPVRDEALSITSRLGISITQSADVIRATIEQFFSK